MLESKVIVYDDSCPMCKAYTQGFVRLGILTSQHRIGFAHAASAYRARLDLNRARHEIPLIDLETGEVTYGMDTLFLLIGHRFPIFAPLFRNRRFRAGIYHLYQIVTYNRRVIAGCAPPRDGFNCTPDFNRAVRLRYLRFAMFAWAFLIVGAVGKAVSVHQPLLAILLGACAAIQAARLVSTRRAHCSWDRAGSRATNNLSFSLLLIPALLPLPAEALWIDFALASVVTLGDAVRRERNCQHCLCGHRICRHVKRRWK